MPPPSVPSLSDLATLSRDPRLHLAVFISLTLGTLATIVMGAFWLRGRVAWPVLRPTWSVSSRPPRSPFPPISNRRLSNPKAQAIEQLSAAGASLWLTRVDGASTSVTVVSPGTRFDSPQGDATLADFAQRDLVSVHLMSMPGRPFTDADLEHLFALPTVEDVRLMGSNVTDAGLARLGQLPNLKRLTLTQSNCTDAALQQFEQTHRHIRVSHDHGARARSQGR